MCPNLGHIFLARSARLSFHRIQLHLKSKSPLAGEKAFTLYVAVYHDDHGGVIIHIADDNGHGV